MAAELGNAAVSGVASKVAESLFDSMKREISYVFKYKRYVDELENQVKQLGHKRQRVEQSVKHAERQGEEIYEDVQEWLSSVEDFTRTMVESITEDEAKKRCFKGSCFCPNLIKQYTLSKKAVKAAKDGANLLGRGNFSSVSFRPAHAPAALRRTNSIYSGEYEAFDSRMSLSRDILEALRDSNVNMIGVYGMGGVGKTTLVIEVARQALEEKLFDTLVAVEVTQTPDRKTIQEKIACDLSLEFGPHETVYDRAGRLHHRFNKEKRVLIILDNIWSKLDLDATGIPFGGDVKESAQQQEDDQRRCTILLTSRSQHVLCNDMNTQKDFSIGVLSNEESRYLFKKILGDSAETSDFQPVADEIVGKCGGLPIAIKTIANALKNKRLTIWKDALGQLRSSNPRQIPGMDENVYSVIELSYNFLRSDEAKALFLLCSLLNSGSQIFMCDLMTYGMGLGLFPDVYTLEARMNRVQMLVHNLKASCLLLDGDTEDGVKMHDIIHSVALSIASAKLIFNIQNFDTGSKEEIEEKISEDSTAISIPYRNIYELPERLECPKLKLFLLFTENISLRIPDLFFEGVKELQVLDLIGIRSLSLPSSLGDLTNLQTLYLESCQLRDVAMVGELKKLEILSFSDSDIEELPGEIRQLTRLKLLDLSYCSKLQVISPNVISSLSRLEELYMSNSFVQWGVEGGQNNASLAELRKLSQLTTLDVLVSDGQAMPHDLLLEKLESYRILIGNVWNWSGKFEASRSLKLKLDNGIHLGHGIKVLLKKTEDLYLDEVNGVKSVLYELDWEGFPHLKHLHVQNNSELLHLVHSVKWGPRSAFPVLESLFLHNLVNLEKISHCDQLAMESFTKLRIIEVGKCDRLTHLFSLSMAKNLAQLQEIKVADCQNLRGIFGNESDDELHVDQNEIGSSKIEFTQLRFLTLQFLPRLISFCFNLIKMPKPLVSQTSSGISTRSNRISAEDELDHFMSLFNEKVVLPSLEKLTLSSVKTKKIWLDQLPAISSCSQNLKSLVVEGCSGLKFLFSSSMFKSTLAQLQRLEIRNCESIESIVDDTEGSLGGGGGGETNAETMSLPQLFCLELEDLPKLTRFGTGNNLVELPSLNEFRIEKCPNLQRFMSRSTSTYTHISAGGTEPQCINLQYWLNNLHPLFDEKVVAPSLLRLKLSAISMEKICHNQIPEMSSCIQNLRVLIIHGCDNLKHYLFSSSMVKSLLQLRVLEICNCKFIERVVVEEEKEGISEMLFSEKLKKLKLKHLPKLTRFCNIAGDRIELSSLAALWIENCPNMKTFISFKEEPVEMNIQDSIQPFFDKKVGLPNLEILMIQRIDNLRKLWDKAPAVDYSFCKLSHSFSVWHCDKLLNIFTSNMLGKVQRLEKLSLWKCDSVEDIFEAVVKEEVEAAELQRFVFPKLTSLRLVGMPRLKSFYPRMHVSEWPVLKKLQVSECDKVELLASEFLNIKAIHGGQGQSQQVNDIPIKRPLFLVDKAAFPNLKKLKLSKLPQLLHLWREEEDHPQPNKAFQNLAVLELSECGKLENLVPSSVTFQNLTTLEVSKCDGLISLVRLSTARSLMQLRKMHITDCNMIKEIITHSGDKVKDEIIVFRKLKYLELNCLPSLTSFCIGNYGVEFPSLKKLTVRQCSKMEVFCQGALNTPKLRRLRLTEGKHYEWRWEGDLNTTIQQLFKEMNFQSPEEDRSIS